MVPDQSLPEPLPAEPLATAAVWLAEAMEKRDQPNPNAMVLATCSDGRPSARVVLCKGIDAAAGSVSFVSNYGSRKGQELAGNPRAAVVMHWDHVQKQVRLEGVVQRASTAESNRYFASRHRDSQLGAHASEQSEPVGSKAALRAQLDAVKARFPGEAPVPRPADWGVYVMWIDAVELWVAGAARLHDRAVWKRTLSVSDAGIPTFGSWSSTRLQP